jgi:hypothetical protein
LPTLRRIKDFFDKNIFDQSVQELADDLSTSISRRLTALTQNSKLRITSILDPRFAYDKLVFSTDCWNSIEDELKEFAKTGIILHYNLINLKNI